MLSLAEEPLGDVYNHLIEYLMANSERFRFTMHPDHLSESGKRVLRLLSTFLVERTRDRERVHFLFRADEEAAKILKREASALYQWRHPELPEDLLFIRNSIDTWFEMKSHDGRASILADARQLYELHRAVPGLQIQRNG